MSSDLQTVLTTIDNRHEMADGDLTEYLAENFSGSLLSLKQLQPLISEILRRFKRLPRKQSVDGTYPTIAGYRTFGAVPEKCIKCHRPFKKHNDDDHSFELDLKTVGDIGWCQGVLHRCSRTVRYMLAGGNKSKASSGGRGKSIRSAEDILNYLDNHVSDLSKPQQKMLAQGLPQFLNRLKRSVWECPKQK